MPVKPKRLSSRLLGPFKWIAYGLYGIIAVGLIYLALSRKNWFFHILQFGVWIYGMHLLISMTRKLHYCFFDDQYLYVHSLQPELIIPLENIESVEIVTLGGTYKVNLYHAEQLGKEFYFKTSVLYPLNYQSKDELVNELRTAIEAARRRNLPLPANALVS